MYPQQNGSRLLSGINLSDDLFHPDRFSINKQESKFDEGGMEKVLPMNNMRLVTPEGLLMRKGAGSGCSTTFDTRIHNTGTLYS